MPLFIFQMPLVYIQSSNSQSKITLPLGIHLLHLIIGSCQGLNLVWLPHETKFEMDIYIHKVCWGGLYGDFSFTGIREVTLGRETKWTVMPVATKASANLMEALEMAGPQEVSHLGGEKIQIFESHHSVDDGCPKKEMWNWRMLTLMEEDFWKEYKFA